MLFAFVFGLTGSAGHCVGMCSGVMLLLSRRGVTSGWRVALAHLGRVTTYATLGLLAGAFGAATSMVVPDLHIVQGVLALSAALVAGVLALGLAGIIPSPENYLSAFTHLWGKVMRRAKSGNEGTNRPVHALAAFGLGLLWGLLPCGLVLAALLVAATTGSPALGAVTMLAFGVGTWPAFLLVYWIAQRKIALPPVWARFAAVLVLLLFGGQMALRGLAAWGWVGHAHMGSVMVW